MIWVSGEQGELFKKLYCEGKREKLVTRERSVGFRKILFKVLFYLLNLHKFKTSGNGII